MKAKILLPLALLAGMVLTGCNKEPAVEYGVEIANKAELQEEWHVKESARALDIKLTPEGNVLAELNNHNLTITSDHPEFVSVTGININPVAAGSATVTVNYHDKTDSVKVTVGEERGEPAHVTATVSQMLANLADGKEKDVIYEIDAYVVAWQSGKSDPTKYGNYMIADAKGETDKSKQILVYGSSANAEGIKLEWQGSEYKFTQEDSAKDFLTNEVTKDVGIGSKLKMNVIAYLYNGSTAEVSGLVKEADNSGAEHHDYPEPAVVKDATLASFIADKQGNKKQAFEFTTTIKGYKAGADAFDQYGNMVVTDGTNELIVYGCTVTASALAWNKDAGEYGFNNPKDFLTNDATKGIKLNDELKVRFVRCDYTAKDGTVTVEGCGIILAINGVEPTPAPGPEPSEGDILVIASEVGASSSDFAAASVTKNGLTISFTAVKDGGDHIRVTKDKPDQSVTSTVTFSGVTIVKIKMTCKLDYNESSKYGADGFTADSGTIKAEAPGSENQVGYWEGEASTLVLTATNHQVRVISFEITLKK